MSDANQPDANQSGFSSDELAFQAEISKGFARELTLIPHECTKESARAPLHLIACWEFPPNFEDRGEIHFTTYCGWQLKTPYTGGPAEDEHDLEIGGEEFVCLACMVAVRDTEPQRLPAHMSAFLMAKGV